MGDNTKGLLMFIFGAAIGSVATWKIVSEKEKARSNAEIDDMAKYYEQKLEDLKDCKVATVKKHEEISEECNEEEFSEEDKDEYEEIAKDYYSGPDRVVNKPYVIEPGEFGEKSGYDTLNLTYYADGVIVDDLSGEVVDDVETMIGLTLDKLGEYEDDALHVRNDELETDFEILAVEDRFKEE